MTLEEAIKHCKEEAEKYMEYGIETECYQCGQEHEQLAEWLTELQELRLQIGAPKLGSIEEYHYELARCKAAFWSCNKRCMDAEEQYRRKADELRKAQEQIAEYKRLLKAAVEDLRYLESHTVDEEGSCLISDRGERIQCFDCPFNNGGKVNEKCVWNYEAEALKLL